MGSRVISLRVNEDIYNQCQEAGTVVSTGLLPLIREQVGESDGSNNDSQHPTGNGLLATSCCNHTGYCFVVETWE